MEISTCNFKERKVDMGLIKFALHNVEQVNVKGKYEEGKIVTVKSC